MLEQMIKVTDRIFYLPAYKETDRPILGYIRGDKYSFMVDAGNSLAHVMQFNNEIYRLDLQIPKYVGITHGHWDHCYGLHAVQSISIACRKTNELLSDMSKWKWSDEAMKKRLETGEDVEFCDIHIRKEYPNRDKIVVKTADIIFEDKIEIDLGSISCVMIRVGGQHAEDSVVIYVPSEKFLFLGDAIYEKILGNDWIYPYKELQVLISNLEEIDFNQCLPGHEELQTKEELLTYLRKQLRSENDGI